MKKQPHVWVFALRGALLALGAGATVACSGGSPQSVASPASAGAGTTLPLTISTVPSSPALTMALAAPSGYLSQVSIQYASAPPGTTVAVKSSVASALGLPTVTTLSSGVRNIDPTAVEYAVMLSLVIVAAEDVIVNGLVTFTQAFPPGTLSSSASYSLAYYDSALPDLGWIIISGPVKSTDGTTLTFSATVQSKTFQAGQQYGFAIVPSGT